VRHSLMPSPFCCLVVVRLMQALSAIVNNAAWGSRAPIEFTNIEEARKMFDVRVIASPAHHRWPLQARSMAHSPCSCADQRLRGSESNAEVPSATPEGRWARGDGVLAAGQVLSGQLR
jgi:hypothetical protein